MALKKITELQTAEEVKLAAAHVVATQPETPEGAEDPIESARRVPIAVLAEAISQILRLGENFLSMNKLTEMYPDMVKNVAQDPEGIRITFWDGTEEVIPVAASGGLAFDGGYVDDNGYLHLTQEGLDIDGFDPFFVGSGGGGATTGSKLTFAMTSSTSFSVAETAGTAPLTFNFLSFDAASEVVTGNGTLKIYVNGTLKRSLTIQQGPNTIDVFEYLSTGANTVKLVLTDSYGATATRTCNITRESLTLSWNLEETMKNSGALTVNLTPTGTGSKKVIVKVDGDVYSEDTVTTSGRRLTKNIAGLPHGDHLIEAYCTLEIEGTTLTSDVLTAAIAQIEEGITLPVIASSFTAETAMQFTSINIVHRVIDPVNNPAEVEYIVNGETYDTDTIDQSAHTWSYRPTAAGPLTLEIVCGDQRWSHALTVTELESPAEEVTEGLKLKFEPATIASLSGWEHEGITIQLSEKFDTVNGGLKTDSDGARGLLVMKGDRAVMNFNMFGDDARKTGKEVKVIYKVENCSDFDAVAVSCFSGGIGMQLKANAVSVNSEQSVLDMQTCEGMRTELDINIEPDTANRVMTFWEDGSHAKAVTYAEADNFTQAEPVGITIGSDDCNVWVYLIRCYASDLSDTEIKANYAADGKDGAEISKRYDESLIYDSAGNIDPERCAEICPDAHVMTWHGPGISTSKENKITGYLTHKFIAGGPEHSWTAYNAVDKVQGTSSAAYVLAALNHDFEAKEGFTLEDGTVIPAYAMTENSIPVSYFNFKVNTASSEHINNILMSEWYHRFQRYKRVARVADPRVRDCVEGHMALLFYHNTGTEPVLAGSVTVQPDETILYGIGNLNNSKKNLEVFAQNDEDDAIVIEVANNTGDTCRFKSADLSTETWDGETNFEFRHLSDTVTQAEAVALWQRVLDFVVACDPEKATSKALSAPVEYDGVTYNLDTTAYRKAKFKAEAGNYFVMDSVIYHKLFTLVFCLPDNRAKNTFWGYSKKLGKWHLCFSYDHDTAMGNDNEGGLTLRYGYLDTDTIGTKNVYNAADSVIFKLVDAVFWDEMRDMFIELENEGCWDFDAFAALCDRYQSMICPAIWAEDSKQKYISPLIYKGSSAYLPMLNGKKRLQRAQFLKFQRQFMSSYFTGNYCTSNTGTIRGYTPTAWGGITPASKITITPYCDMFVVVKAGSITSKVRAYAGVPVEIDLGVPSMNDTEIYPYNAPFIQDLGELACLYPGYVDLAPFTRLKRASIGSSVSGYSNTNLTEVSVENCEALEYMNVENCPALVQALSLSNNVMLKELYTRGSGVTGITFAPGARLRTANLNAIVSLTAKSLNYVEALTMESYDNLSTLVIEESPAIDSLQLVEISDNLARVRLIKVDWTMDNSAVLVRISKIGGVDDDGYNTEHSVLTGDVHVDYISETRLSTLTAAFPGLTITHSEILEEHVVRFVLEDGTVWDEQIVEHGSAAERPAADPTKESTVDTVYTFRGWSGSYANILQDTTLTPIFTESVRTYTVTFMNGSKVVQTSVVNCYEGVDYTGADLEKAGHLWTGWDASTKSVTSDMVVNAVFEAPALPAQVADMTQFDYLFSDDPADRSAYTIGEIYAICAAGLGSTYMAVGDKLKITMTESASIFDDYIIFQVYGFNHFKLEDGSNFANVVFGMLGVLNTPKRMNPTNTNAGGWPVTEMRTYLNQTVLYDLPTVWRNVIKSVQVLSSAGETSAEIVNCVDKLFLFSRAEVGGNINDVPYCNEVDADAENRNFSIFTNDASRIKKYYNGTGAAAYWWLRSPIATYATAFSLVNYIGGVGSTGASYTNGVAFGFCI